MAVNTGNCSRCGTPGQGSYCARCGAPLRSAPSAAAQPTPPRGRLAVVAAVLGVGFLALAMVWAWPGHRSGSPAAEQAPPAVEAGPGAPPDISSMSPRERFDRLYNRVMRAAEQGDTTTVTRFAPMAFLAYTQLDTVDADARYHTAVLRLHVQGDTAAALRLADTIQMANPHHLFAFLIRGTAGRLVNDGRLLARANSDFLAAWDQEIKAARPEYRDHRTMLDQFHASAIAGGAKGTPP